MDLGATGAAVLGGTLAAPTLSGAFASTGGTISFYRTFVVQPSTVTFSPDMGIVPLVDASATTHLNNPDTNILLHATGLATNLNVDFASDPSYSREQIVGLLANVQALGVAGFPRTSGTGSAQPSLLESTAVGYVNDKFTQALLEPLQSQIGQSLGLQNLQIDAGLGGNFGLNATANLGRRLTAKFAESYGTSRRQSIGLQEQFNAATSLQLTVFNAAGALQALSTQGILPDPTQPTDLSLLTLIPPAGTNGVTFSYQHHFW